MTALYLLVGTMGIILSVLSLSSHLYLLGTWFAFCSLLCFFGMDLSTDIVIGIITVLISTVSFFLHILSELPGRIKELDREIVFLKDYVAKILADKRMK